MCCSVGRTRRRLPDDGVRPASWPFAPARRAGPAACTLVWRNRACSSAPTPPLPCCREWCGGQGHNHSRRLLKLTFARTDTLTASVGLRHPHRLPRFSVGGRRRGRSHGAGGLCQEARYVGRPPHADCESYLRDLRIARGGRQRAIFCTSPTVYCPAQDMAWRQGDQ